jgi:thiol-disulfide isomerase/thioredoxin
MASFTEILSRFFRPFIYPVIIILILAIFVGVAYWVIQKYYPGIKESVTFNDIANTPDTAKNATITLYYATWCPACKRAKPEWDDFVQEYSDGKLVNGHVINCTEVDCSNNDDPQIAAIIQEYKINGFPTVQMYVDGNTINFDSAVTKSTLELFVNQML